MDGHNSFGELFKQLRLARGFGLRQFCVENGLDPGNVSRLERDRVPIPNQEVLERYARALGVAEGSSEWFEYFDAAAAAAGRIPDDLLSDEEIVGKLPLVFRTLRGQPVDPDKLRDLAERIRRA